MNCPACHSENPADSRFCHKCGTSIDLTSSPTMTFSPGQQAASHEALRFMPGEKFGDRYTIIEEIGHGGMGRVYKARDDELGKTVVLKMIRPELTSRPGMVDQFKKEALHGLSVSHENVVRIHNLGEIDKVRYISMDFIKGENLSEFIQASETLTLSTCLKVAIQVCQALIAAHKNGVIHQDLKPQNIMIDNSGKVYVTDFGLATSVAGSEGRRPGKVFGTPKYLSPEQARGEESDARSDIYSLGAILYEMVTSAAPFKADTVEGYIKKHTSERPAPPSKLNPDLPPACEKIILKCLEKKKEDRYQSVEELLRDLEVQKKHLPRMAFRTSRWLKVLTAAALVCLAGIGLHKLWKLIHPTPPERPTGRIAVMYAVNNSGDKSLDGFRWVIPYYLVENLSQSKYLSILPQDKLMQLLLDLKQLNEERPLSKTLDRIADAANVSYFVLPSFAKTGDDFRISATVRKAKTDATVGVPDTVTGKKLEDLTKELALKVKSGLNLTPSEIAGDTGQNLAKTAPPSLEAVRYYVEAEIAYAQSDHEASLRYLKKAIQEAPNYAMAHLKMADNYLYVGDYANHKESLRKALSLVDSVSERERYFIQGCAAQALDEDPRPAIEFFKTLISRYPDYEDAYLELGSIYRVAEEWGSAMDQFEKVLRIHPNNTLAIANKASIYTSTGRYQEAFELGQSCAANGLNVGYFRLQVPLLFLIQGRFDRSAEEIDTALARAPDDLEFIELKGAGLLLKGDFASARQVFEHLQLLGEASAEKPDLRGRYWLALQYLTQGRYRQAQQEISAALELARKAGVVYEPARGADEFELQFLLAYSDLMLKRYSQAAEALKAVGGIAEDITYRNYKKRSLQLLGLAYLGLGRVEEAKRTGDELRGLIEITASPNHMRRYEHLMGSIVLAEGRAEEAVKHFERAVSMLPHQREVNDEQAFFYSGLAAAYYQSGNMSKAEGTFRDILSLTTGRLRWGDTYAQSHYWLGKILQRGGNSGEAKAHYQSFLKLWRDADSGLPEVDDARKQIEVLSKAR